MGMSVWVFFGMLAIGLIWSLRSKRLSILDGLLSVSVFLLYYLIGYAWDISVLSSVAFKEDQLTVSFPGIILLAGTFLLVKWAISKTREFMQA